MYVANHYQIIKKIQNIMSESSINACLFTSNVNLFYLTGMIFDGFYLIPAKGEPTFFVKRPQINNMFGEQVIYIRKPEQISEHLSFDLSSLGLESDQLSANEHLRISNIFPSAKIHNASFLARKCRMIKTELEINLLMETAAKHAEIYKKIPLLYREGMTDIAFSAAIEYEMRKAGHLGLFRIYGSRMECFMGTVLSGDNASAPSPFDFALGGKGPHPSAPLGSTGAVIEKGTSVIVDISGNFNGYLSDCSRTFSRGELPKSAYYAHNVSLEIQDMFISKGKVGTPCCEIYKEAIKIAKAHNLIDCFMGKTQQAMFIGHGLGLEINEPPVFAPRDQTPLHEDMVMALEPKFIIDGVGAVGIENTFVITSDGPNKITNCNEEILCLG